MSSKMAKRNILHIKNLEPEADASAICDVFRNYGKILCVNIAVDDNFVSLGVGYVQFEERKCARLAAEELNDKRTDIGKPLCVYFPEKAYDEQFTNLYVKNFSLKWDDLDLQRQFESFGTIQHSVIEVSNGKSKGYGYVNFENHEDAKAAVKALHNKFIDGKRLYVQQHKKKEVRETLKSASIEYPEENNLYVSNLPKDLTHEQLEDIFNRFGDILSLRIIRNEMNESKGYGFVAFKERKCAIQALEIMNGYRLGSNVLNVKFKQTKSERRFQHTVIHPGPNITLPSIPIFPHPPGQNFQLSSIPKFTHPGLNYQIDDNFKLSLIPISKFTHQGPNFQFPSIPIANLLTQPPQHLPTTKQQTDNNKQINQSVKNELQFPKPHPGPNFKFLAQPPGHLMNLNKQEITQMQGTDKNKQINLNQSTKIELKVPKTNHPGPNFKFPVQPPGRLNKQTTQVQESLIKEINQRLKNEPYSPKSDHPGPNPQLPAQPPDHFFDLNKHEIKQVQESDKEMNHTKNGPQSPKFDHPQPNFQLSTQSPQHFKKQITQVEEKNKQINQSSKNELEISKLDHPRQKFQLPIQTHEHFMNMNKNCSAQGRKTDRNKKCVVM